MSYNHRYWEKYFPQFVQCDQAAVNTLMNAAQRVEVPAGQVVFYPGSQCQNYLLVLEGCVKTRLISENGREILLYYVRSGDSCVLTTSCLLAGDRYPAEGIIEEQATAFAIPAETFHFTLDNSAFFRRFVFENFAKRLSNVISRMEQVVFGPIDLRLARALLDRNNAVVNQTHQELAVELGSAREVISRHLKRYEAYGWIQLRRGVIEIRDFSALEELSGWRTVE